MERVIVPHNKRAMSPVSKRRKVEENTSRECIFGIPLSSVASDELVTLQNPTARAWAPALVWMWTAAGATVHPCTMQPLQTEDVAAILRVAVRSCSSSPTGPVRFLLFSAPHGQCDTRPTIPSKVEAYLSETIAAKGSAGTPKRLAVLYADQLDAIQELILKEAQLDSVTDTSHSLRVLSLTWVWLYDSLWSQLVNLDPGLALVRMLHSALPRFRAAAAEALGFHPGVLLPLLRHFVFLEEYVCRVALQDRSDDGPWRYEGFLAKHQGTGFSSAGYKQWPLGDRSAILVQARPLTADQLSYLEDQLEVLPLAEATDAPPAVEQRDTRRVLSNNGTVSNILAFIRQELERGGESTEHVAIFDYGIYGNAETFSDDE